MRLFANFNDLFLIFHLLLVGTFLKRGCRKSRTRRRTERCRGTFYYNDSNLLLTRLWASVQVSEALGRAQEPQTLSGMSFDGCVFSGSSRNLTYGFDICGTCPFGNINSRGGRMLFSFLKKKPPMTMIPTSTERIVGIAPELRVKGLCQNTRWILVVWARSI